MSNKWYEIKLHKSVEYLDTFTYTHIDQKMHGTIWLGNISEKIKKYTVERVSSFCLENIA